MGEVLQIAKSHLRDLEAQQRVKPANIPYSFFQCYLHDPSLLIPPFQIQTSLFDSFLIPSLRLILPDWISETECNPGFGYGCSPSGGSRHGAYSVPERR